MTQTVLLTGITGFIAKRIAYDLLEQGYKVRGTLRSMDRVEEVKKALAGSKIDNLSFVTVDLMSDAGWDDAMKGIDVVMHTASPFPMNDPKDPQTVIGPAVEGTLRALKAAQAAGVKRVVLTSSMVAIMYSQKDKDHRFGPDDWTDTDHPAATTYVKSKTMAERAAWDFVENHPELELTTIHPGLVVGRPMDDQYGTSLQLVERILSAKDPMQPDVPLPIVDVADVSALHIAAMEQPHTVGKRIVAADGTMRMPQIAEMLADAYPGKGIKTKVAPKFLLRILGLFDNAIKGILPSVGQPLEIDNTNGKDLIGGFIPGKDAILASAKAVE